MSFPIPYHLDELEFIMLLLKEYEQQRLTMKEVMRVVEFYRFD